MNHKRQLAQMVERELALTGADSVTDFDDALQMVLVETAFGRYPKHLLDVYTGKVVPCGRGGECVPCLAGRGKGAAFGHSGVNTWFGVVILLSRWGRPRVPRLGARLVAKLVSVWRPGIGHGRSRRRWRGP